MAGGAGARRSRPSALSSATGAGESRAARRAAAGQPQPAGAGRRAALSAIEANLAKVTITDNAIQAVNIALELTGNHGLSRQNPLERHYRNVLCGRVHTPQSDSAWLAAGNFVFQSQG
ncbi:acyl-CoA dehydrogenase family protein [Klebsiella pneumoniae]